jgi:hypothetical protein
VGRLKAWEVLWFLTCLNHDPGYTGEKFWPAVYARFGLRQGARSNRGIPVDVAEVLSNGWETDLKQARGDLLDLYNRVSNAPWIPPQGAATVIAPFDAALRIAYFDGQRSSHSLLSGLMLIQGFIQDPTQATRAADDRNRCLAACEIAALSMLFHDQRAENCYKPTTFRQSLLNSYLMHR